ncbi:hypothetical protein B5M09_000112 [Aphanomyces astaci]|uniref:Protein kinase domain-containing protein n=1 Tax=Aphanomyces astaci TaxID=112090 RepID=A0A3R7XCH9_APHAT|nr:hypothetical protein B5M09_000112 [Aphanomyces astaci]
MECHKAAVVPLDVWYSACFGFVDVKDRWQHLALVSRAWRVAALASVKAHSHLDLIRMLLLPLKGDDHSLLVAASTRVQVSSIRLYGPRVIKPTLARLLCGVGPLQFRRIDIESKQADVPELQLVTLCRHLHTLHLNCIKLTDDVLVQIAVACTELVELDVAGCSRIGDDGLVAIAMSCPKLQVLDASMCIRMTDHGLHAMALHAPTLNKTLRYLDLTGLIHLLPTSLHRVAVCDGLVSLNLSMCRTVTDTEVAIIAAGCPRLESVSLQGCVHVTDVALTALASHCRDLKSLSLEFCYNISDRGFCTLVQNCLRLTHINVKACNLLHETSFTTLASRQSEVALERLVIGACADLATTAMYASIIKQSFPHCVMTDEAPLKPLTPNPPSAKNPHDEEAGDDVHAPLKAATSHGRRDSLTHMKTFANITITKPIMPMLKSLKEAPNFRHSSFFETSTVNKKHDEAGHKRLNQYILYDVIGQGAFGKVRKAYWPEREKYYAVKIINKKHVRRLSRSKRGPGGDGLETIRKEFAIWKQLIEGIDFLHFHKIIHRDVKPSNLLCGSDGVLKITDFGMSHVFEDENDDFRQTVGTGPFLGTYAIQFLQDE